ncbi:MAG: PEP-utilizing enzyme [Patescibacteria group bacterium]
MTNNDYQLFKQYLKRDWYVQGFSAVPLFLSTAAISGTFMKKYLGFGYRHFLFSYHNGYGEMAYDPADLKHVWLIVKKKLSVNPGYLKEVKALYYQNLRRFQPFLQKVQHADLTRLNDREIIKLFKELIRAQVDYVGVAHIIDAIGAELEKEFQDALHKELPLLSPAKFNEVFARLITPSKMSFVSQEEKELSAIPRGIKNAAALRRHAAKYFWLQNSYAGPKSLTVADFRAKLINLKKEKQRFRIDQCQTLPYRFSRSLRQMVGIIDYCAVWQDERKALLFRNIAYAGRVVEEIARRLDSDVTDFYYISLTEVERLESIQDLQSKIKTLKERRSGCLVIIQGKTDKVLAGVGYRRLMKAGHSLLKDKGQEGRDIHGTVANVGTARGRVRIIRNMESLKKFQSGDVLIASMTRPEYMAAIKKAAAIITDEGGLTCHAAIIARELDIPTIIGTKIATRVLKDGDLVEVRANHGIVRILN